MIHQQVVAEAAPEALQQLGSPGLTPAPAAPSEAGPPSGFYMWFWAIAALAGLVLARYYARMDGDRLEVVKLLTSSVMPLGILTVVVLAVILFG